MSTTSHAPAAALPRTIRVPAVLLPPSGHSAAVSARLTPLQFAARVGLSRASVYRYLGSAALPDHLVTFAGARRILIAPEAVDHFLAHWRLERGAS